MAEQESMEVMELPVIGESQPEDSEAAAVGILTEARALAARDLLFYRLVAGILMLVFLGQLLLLALQLGLF